MFFIKSFFNILGSNFEKIYAPWLPPKTNKLIIENINVVKRHKKPDQQNQSGGIINKEMPIDISNVKVIANG